MKRGNVAISGNVDSIIRYRLPRAPIGRNYRILTCSRNIHDSNLFTKCKFCTECFTIPRPSAVFSSLADINRFVSHSN